MLKYLNLSFCLFLFFILGSVSPIYLFADQKELIVFFTGEDNGRLEPCGCATAQLGGLPRRHSFLDHLRIGENKNILLLSNGDLIDGVGRQDELKFQTTIQAMHLMGYQVMNLGEKDFQFGVDYLKSMQPLSQFPFISSNVTDPEGTTISEKIFSHEVEMGGKEVELKIIGVMSPSFKTDLGPFVNVLDPVHVVRGLLGENKDPSIFWILLYHGKLEEARTLSEHFPQINVVITGHELEEPPPLEFVKVGERIVAPTPMKGKYVGKLTLSLGEDGRFHFKDLDYIDLDEKVGSSKVVETLLEDYQLALKAEKIYQALEARNIEDGKSFVGSETCAPCHIGAFTIWKDSRHPHAYKSIVPVKRQFDPDCLICHSTGFKYISGFAGTEKTTHLAEVGCETCHGAGSLHIESPVDNRMIKPGVGTCVGCHDPENSPNFEFEKYWEKIKH